MPKGRTPQHVDEAQIVADFRAGLTLQQVRDKYHIGDARARIFRTLATQDFEPEQEADATEVDEASQTPEGEPLFPGNPDCFHLDTYVPVDRVDFALSNLTREDAIAALLNLDPPDKALALEFLIQRLIKAMVAEVDVQADRVSEDSISAGISPGYSGPVTVNI
jgi:hypothetical protein